MELTYLGHQGWAFESGNEFVLLDPIFTSIGNGPVQLPIWPDRQVDPAQLPPITGLVLSHEHSDHFDVDTLLRMPYRGDVWISDRSSGAQECLLQDLGFTVRRMNPYQVLNFGSLRAHVLPLRPTFMEPDTYGFLVQDLEVKSSFLTSVDGLPHNQTLSWLADNFPNRTVDNFTNNHLEGLAEVTGVAGSHRYSMGKIMMAMSSSVMDLRPSTVLLSGQGWSYPFEYSRLNKRFFSSTHRRSLPILEATYPEIGWHAPEPGDRFVLSEIRAVKSETLASFVQSRPAADRTFVPGDGQEDCRPWSGIHEVSEGEFHRALGHLTEDFGYRICRESLDLDARLNELAAHRATTHEPRLAVRLRNGEEVQSFVLQPGRQRFEPTQDADVYATTAIGFDIWASDLLLLFDGREEAYLIYETAVRRWNRYPAILGEFALPKIFNSFQPRHMPAQFLATYRRRLNHVSGGAFPTISIEVAERRIRECPVGEGR